MLQIPFLDLNLIYTIALAFHGIGHIIGILFLGPVKSESFTQHSWILQDKVGLSATVVRGLALLWFIPAAGFVGAAWGFWTGLVWWRLLTWIMVPFSVLLFILWWKAFPKNIPIQAQIGNVVALIGLILL
jgi:hypothetical protein